MFISESASKKELKSVNIRQKLQARTWLYRALSPSFSSSLAKRALQINRGRPTHQFIGLWANNLRIITSSTVNSHTYYYLVFHHRLTVLFHACWNLPFLQILPAWALPFSSFRIHYMDSPDCSLLFLSISVFYFSLFFSVSTLYSGRFREVG